MFEQLKITQVINQYSLLKTNEEAKAFEDGTVAELHWRRLMKQIPKTNPFFLFFKEAVKNATLNKVLPSVGKPVNCFTSEKSSPFARLSVFCSKNHFSDNCSIYFIRNNFYEAADIDGKSIGTGNAKQIVDKVAVEIDFVCDLCE